MLTKSNKVFVSAELSGKSDSINHQNHIKALNLLKREGSNFAVVKGVYKNVAESTFMLYADSAKDHAENLSIALNLGALFNQESVLEVHNDDTAVLHYVAGNSEKIGQFTEVNEAEALTHNCYTFSNGRYYVVR